MNLKPDLCRGCPLYEAQGPVLPSLTTEASIVIIGEAPGREEITKGIPFIGKTGKYLRSMFMEAGLKMSSCIVTNTVLCRPPQNRTPTKAEIDYCTKRFLKPFLSQHLDKKWLAIGTVASKAIIGEKVTASAGYIFPNPNGNSIISAILHPSAILRGGGKDRRPTVLAIVKFLKATSALDAPTDELRVNPELVELREFVDKAFTFKKICIDIETLGKDSDTITLLAITLPDMDTISIPWTPSRIQVVKPLLEDESIAKIIHNVAFDAWKLYLSDIDVSNCELIDTIQLAQMCDEPDKSLEKLAAKYLNTPSWKRKAGSQGMSTYNAKDTYHTMQLYKLLRPKIFQATKPLYEELKILPKIALKMTIRGVRIDLQTLAAIRTSLTKDLSDVQAVWKSLYGNLNPGSYVQVQKNIKEMGYQIPRTGVIDKATGRRKPSSNERALVILRKKGDDIKLFCDLLLKYRELTKAISTYLDFPYDEDGVVHAQFNTAIPITGRWSSSNPNMQNIPPSLRKMFVARPGYTFIRADYSQAEARIIAHLAQEAHMLDAWKSGLDIHTYVASKVYAVPYEEVLPEQRQASKTIVYALSYGSGAAKIAEAKDLPLQEVRSFLAAFKKEFPAYAQTLDDWGEEAVTHGFQINTFGRVHHFQGDRTFQQGKNFKPQSTVADQINSTIIKVYNYLQDKDAFLVLQVHDELVVECRDEILDEVASNVQQIMTAPIEFRDLPSLIIPVEVGYGKTWGDTKG